MPPLQEGHTDPAGELGLQVNRGGRVISVDPAVGLGMFDQGPKRTAENFADIISHGFPQSGLPGEVNLWRRKNFSNLWRGLGKVAGARMLHIPHLYGALFLRKFTGDGQIIDYGLASMRLITDNGMGYVVDAFQNLVELENMKFHGFGTGTTAESATDSALVTELTTEYVTNSTRPTGTTAEASQKVYQTVATLAPDSGGVLAITEHGVFSASSAGVLLDRSKFSAVNLDSAAGDSLQATYQATFNSGG